MRTPVEQFEIVPLLKLEIYENIVDITITNLVITNAITTSFVASTAYYVVTSKHKFLVGNTKKKENSIFLVPNRWQLSIEYLILVISQIVSDNLANNSNAQKFLPFIFSLFNLIFLTNMIGLLPYNFTVTSHLLITFLMSFSVFFGTTSICLEKHRYKMIQIFVPSNLTFFLTFLLVPIEVISYLSKPISLGVRLFINLMAGHCLLKVIVGFSWDLLSLDDIFPILHILPLMILILLIGLELGVALIQTYVFTILTCIYVNDSIKLH